MCVCVCVCVCSQAKQRVHFRCFVIFNEFFVKCILLCCCETHLSYVHDCMLKILHQTASLHDYVGLLKNADILFIVISW